MQCNLFKPSSFLKQLIIYKMCFVKRMKLHDLLGNPSFPKKLIIHISGNIHIFTGQSLNLRERNGKINQRYRAIFTWRWNENVRTKQKQQMNTYRVIWVVYRTDTSACGFWLVKRTLRWKNFMSEKFLKINQYRALTSYCNKIGQLNNAVCKESNVP